MTVQRVLGLDYGTDSVRAMIVDCESGEELSSGVSLYPRWKEGLYCEPGKSQFRQHPQDYIDSLIESVSIALKSAPEGTAETIVGIGIDTTGSTPVAVDQQGTALALKDEFKENPNAMFVLWKDHTAVEEADEINHLAKNWGGVDYTKYVGGIYSSEWLWAKILHVSRADEKVHQAAYSWVEHCDWIPALLTNQLDPIQMKRGRCSAGHKAMWHNEWEGLPSDDFLSQLDPLLKGLRDRLYSDTYTSDVSVGGLCEEWSKKLGLKEGILVAVGAFDCHMGAVGSNMGPYTLSKVMGTSTCDIVVVPSEDMKGKFVKGICGQVDGSVIPGMEGLEAGQSAFGDIYAWFRSLISWPVKNLLHVHGEAWSEEERKALEEKMIDDTIVQLTKQASEIAEDETSVLALDWMNGRRTPDANQNLKGVISGIDLGTDAPKIFKALVEATAFGSKAIMERIEEEGIPIKDVVALGGIAKKSDYVMQICADVLNRQIKVVSSEQCCALGAAMFAATAAGVFKTVEEAQEKMNSGFSQSYEPVTENVNLYEEKYHKYKNLASVIEKETTKV